MNYLSFFPPLFPTPLLIFLVPQSDKHSQCGEYCFTNFYMLMYVCVCVCVLVAIIFIKNGVSLYVLGFSLLFSVPVPHIPCCQHISFLKHPLQLQVVFITLKSKTRWCVAVFTYSYILVCLGCYNIPP
jgi:hypothetical protein